MTDMLVPTLLGLILFCLVVGLLLVAKLIRKTRGVVVDQPLITRNSNAPLAFTEDAGIATAGILIAPADLSDADPSNTSARSTFDIVESILRTVPSLANVLTSAGGVFRLSFSPDVVKGLSDGSFSLMKSGGQLKTVAVDKAGKIVGQGNLSPDRLVSSVAVVSAVWQVLAVVTAQKFLSDINKRLASIEEGVRRLSAWMQEQEQGRYLGNMRYLGELSSNVTKELSSDEALLLRGQLESVYRESLQAIESNSLRAKSSLENLVATKFDGNLVENETAFRREMNGYFEGISYVIKFRYVAAVTEFMSAVIERKAGRELDRLAAIIREAESLLLQVQSDSDAMKKRSALVAGGFWDSEAQVKEKRRNIRRDMETLVSACEESTQRIVGVSDSAQKLKSYLLETEEVGLHLIVEIDSKGSVTKVSSALPSKVDASQRVRTIKAHKG